MNVEKEPENVNIRINYSIEFSKALDANPELNDETNYLLNRFFNSDWGEVSEKESEEFIEIINTHEGCVTGRYTACGERILIELFFEDRNNAVLSIKFNTLNKK